MKSLNVIYRVTALQIKSPDLKGIRDLKKYSGQLDLMENFPVNIPIM